MWILYIVLCSHIGNDTVCITKTMPIYTSEAACQVAAGQWVEDDRLVATWCELGV